ncbi:hypothetical protein FOPG_17514 [Fusarium oxysporum f. sp. conglutinans race 2 54008]|nr:hypothetical protein FOPG_17514 [Fusarium oxysporum f. sp. conglutinans race 2 54008]
MPADAKLELDPHIPWREPAWYRSQSSPYYNQSHRKLRDNVRSYIDKHILPFALGWEQSGTVPAKDAAAFVRSGIPFDDVPSDFRPSDVLALNGLPDGKADVFHSLIIADEMARIEGGVGIGLAGASSVGVPPIVHYGTSAQKNKWLPGLFSKETSFCLGITEPNAGSDVAQIQTTADKSGDGTVYTVNGVKKWITGAPWASHMTTAVRTGGPGKDGISVLVIPMSSAGVHCQKLNNSGHSAAGASIVDLDDVEVPVENLIGEENKGFEVLMRNFNRERFLLAVSCNRKSRTCLSLSFQYAMTRETFGKPLIENQVIRRKLVEMSHRVEAHWAWLEQITFHIQNSPLGWQSPEIAGQIALLKIQGGQMLELASREAQQIFGGAGYQRGGKGATIEQISRDLRLLVIGGGSEEILSDLTIRQELSGMRRRVKL